jgi:hypothetical protein
MGIINRRPNHELSLILLAAYAVAGIGLAFVLAWILNAVLPRW